MDTIVSAAKLAGNLVAHRWSLFQIVSEKQRELSVARKTWRASLSCDSLALLGSWDFPLFQRLLDEAGYEDKHLLHDISCLPLTGLAPVSGVLSPKSVHATVSLSEFWSKVPQRNVEVFNRVGPTGDSELDRRASDKTHEEFALGLMDGPYNSLEECPGEHKVLVRRKPRWQSGDVRNIDDCSENGINETFESKETYKPAGIDHHVSAIKIVGNFPSWCHASRVCCRFVEAFQADWHWFEPHCRFLVPQFWFSEVWKATRLPFWGCSLCPRLCSPSFGNVCTFATSFACSGAALSR